MCGGVVQDRTVQPLLGEALNELFRKHFKRPIAWGRTASAAADAVRPQAALATVLASVADISSQSDSSPRAKSVSSARPAWRPQQPRTRGSVDTWQRPQLRPGGRIRDRLDSPAEAMHRTAQIAMRGDRRGRSPFAGDAGLAMLPPRPKPFDVPALDSAARLCPLARVPYAVVFSQVATRGRAGNPADEIRALRACPCDCLGDRDA